MNGQTTAEFSAHESRGVRRIYCVLGWSLTGLTVLFLLLDSLAKIGLQSEVVAGMTRIGYPVDVIRPIGSVLLACTILYAIPRTTFLGAMLLTGYMGGAIASNLRVGQPLFSEVLLGLYFGIVLWAGLYLRDARWRPLMPLRRRKQR